MHIFMKEANKVDFNGGLVVLTGFIPSTPQDLKIISQSGVTNGYPWLSTWTKLLKKLDAPKANGLSFFRLKRVSLIFVDDFSWRGLRQNWWCLHRVFDAETFHFPHTWWLINVNYA